MASQPTLVQGGLCGQSVPAGGHMESALDHADIRGLATAHLGRTGACLPLEARIIKLA